MRQLKLRRKTKTSLGQGQTTKIVFQVFLIRLRIFYIPSRNLASYKLR
jgi:hypothetical protein